MKGFGDIVNVYIAHNKQANIELDDGRTVCISLGWRYADIVMAEPGENAVTLAEVKIPD
jgi:hypothetical protein